MRYVLAVAACVLIVALARADYIPAPISSGALRQVALATTASNGTWSVTFTQAFPSTPVLQLNVQSGGAASPNTTTCNLTSVSTTAAAGFCSSSTTVNGTLSGNQQTQVLVGSGVVVGVAGSGATQ